MAFQAACHRGLFLFMVGCCIIIQCDGSWSHLEKLYCGSSNCYAILGLTRDADLAAIKRAFRRLSLQIHPDKNPDPLAARTFAAVAKAYEVLSSPTTRTAYNYFLDDPESFYSFYYGYRASYPAPTHPLFVCLAVVLFISLGQFMNARWAYENCRQSIMRSDQFKRAVEFRLSETHGSIWKKMSAAEQKKARKDVSGSVLDNQVQVNGASPRQMELSQLLAVQICLLPIKLAKWIWWDIRWLWVFTVRRQEYGPAEEEYLTRSKLRYSLAQWDRLGEAKRDGLIRRKLWAGQNYAFYLKEATEAEREARAKNSKYKQWKRWKKKNSDTVYMMDE